MSVYARAEPVRWWVFDNWSAPIAAADIPPPTWAGWEVGYDNDCERGKRTARRDLPPAAATIVSRLRGAAAEWSARLGYQVEDDPHLHGGGLHVTGPGGWLSTHLDYDRHPLLPGQRRALNLIAFIHPEWRDEWGGAFVLCDPLGRVVERIRPRPGRLVAFEVGDLSYHGVEPVTGPVARATAAVYFLAPAGPTNTRQRALFMPRRQARPTAASASIASATDPANSQTGPATA